MIAEITRNLIKSFECCACKHDNEDGENCNYCVNLSKFELDWEVESELRQLEKLEEIAQATKQLLNNNGYMLFDDENTMILCEQELLDWYNKRKCVK